jgi:hypothetical protein
MHWSQRASVIFLVCLALVSPVILIASPPTNPRQAMSSTRTPDKRSPSSKTWSFAVSGDSRNCGDVVMPAIATGVTRDQASFYWHLGDLRKISAPDEDFRQLKMVQGKPFTVDDYEKEAWTNFVDNQIEAFGTLPFFLGIGNHETIPPKTRAEFIQKFAKWLDAPELHEQKKKDDTASAETITTYYHWIRDGIDFINLDNATREEFDAAQMKWFEGVITRDREDESVRTLVVGMHEALPESISADHSMDEWELGQRSGQEVYQDLLKLRNAGHKRVYILASHSHFFMDGIFNTEHWKTHGGVLPGWIVGTAGAQRYPLPPDYKDAKEAKTNVYGYLLGTVNPPGEPAGSIRFDFKQLDEDKIPSEVVNRFTAPFVHDCYTGNRR